MLIWWGGGGGVGERGQTDRQTLSQRRPSPEVWNRQKDRHNEKRTRPYPEVWNFF